MTTLTSTLAVRLLDDVSGPAGKAAGALRGLGASGADLRKLASASPEMAKLVREMERLKAVSGKVDTFKVASRGLDDMGLNLRKARQDVTQAERLLARKQKTVEYFNRIKVEQPERYKKWKMDGLTGGVASNLDKARRGLSKAQKALPGAQAEFMEQGRHVRTLRNELGGLGVPLNGIKTAEVALKAAIDATNAAIAKQPALLAAAEAKAHDVARASKEQLRAAVEAGKAARATREANAVRAGRVERARVEVQASRPKLAAEAGAKVEAATTARRQARTEADPLLNPERGVADLRKVPELQKAIAARQALKAQAGAIEDFRVDSRGLKEASQAFRLAQQDLRRLKAEMASAPSDAVATKLAAAHAAVARTSEAFRAQGSAVRSSRAALAEAGVGVDRLKSAEAGLAASIAKATAELQRQTGALAQNAAAQAKATERAKARKESRKEALGTIGAGAGLVAGHKVKEGAKLSLETYREFDRERRFGKAVMGLTDDEQKPLVDQAIHMGATTKYNDVQVLEAQRELAARGLKTDQVMGLLAPASDLGQSLDLSLPAAVKQMEGAIFGFKKPIGTLEEAVASAQQTADVQVKAAKISGMTPDDISQAYKYGATPARMSGVSEHNLLAFAGISKKANMGGDESGVAFRALIAAAQSPTRKGKEAMLANGMDYKNYQRNPEKIDTAAFTKTVASQYGVELDKDTTAGLEKIFTDKAMIASPEQFTPAVMKLLSDNLGGDDAKSKKSIAGLANRFRDASMQGVDTNALITDLMKKLPDNLQLANAIFGSKQGSRIATALGDPETFRHMIEELVNHSEGYSGKISKERMSGFDGAWSRLSGAAKNLETAVGRSWDNDGKGGALTALTDAAGRATMALAELPPGVIQVGSAFAGIAGAAAGAFGAFRVAKAVLGMGSGAALGASAVALDGSAAALTAAAVRLGAGGAADLGKKVSEAAPAVAGAGLATTVGLLGVTVSGAIAAGFAAYAAKEQLPKEMEKRGPGAFDPATGGLSEVNPMEGLAPDRPVALDWLQRKLPGVFGAPDSAVSTKPAERSDGSAVSTAVPAPVAGIAPRPVPTPPVRPLEPGVAPRAVAPPAPPPVAGVPAKAPAAVASPVTVQAPPAPAPVPGVVPRVVVPPAPLPVAGVPARAPAAVASPVTVQAPPAPAPVPGVVPRVVVPSAPLPVAGVPAKAPAAVASPVMVQVSPIPPPAPSGPGLMPGAVAAPAPLPSPGVVPRVAAPIAAAERAARDPRRLALPPEPDVGKIEAATAALAAYRAELASVSSELAGQQGLDLPGVGAGLDARKAELERLIADLQSKLQALGAQTVAPTIDGASVDAFGVKTDAAKDKLSALGATSVTPSVGSGPIDALIAKVDALLGKLAQVGTAATGANARIGQVNAAASAAVGGQSTGQVRQRLSGGFTNSVG